ncbi:MAG: hypothetical protein O7B23_04065, partial [Deltaproteobacteria bacterium]|nr:hypothetical protein [Deltaproteobacteria bacterium]
EVGEEFQAGIHTLRPDELAVRLGVSVREVREAVEPLTRAGILVEPEGEQGYLPTAALSMLSLERILAALRRGGNGGSTR